MGMVMATGRVPVFDCYHSQGVVSVFDRRDEPEDPSSRIAELRFDPTSAYPHYTPPLSPREDGIPLNRPVSISPTCKGHTRMWPVRMANVIHLHSYGDSARARMMLSLHVNLRTAFPAQYTHRPLKQSIEATKPCGCGECPVPTGDGECPVRLRRMTSPAAENPRSLQGTGNDLSLSNETLWGRGATSPYRGRVRG